VTTLTVLAAGPLTLVEDLGRPGLGALGVGASGAADAAAHRLANRLVGNPEQAATLEVLLGGARLRLDGGGWVAVTGAWGDTRGGERRLEPHTATLLAPGEIVDLPPAAAGLRYVVAVRGGIDVPPVLGSRSWDVLARLGPAPVRDGDVLPIGSEPAVAVPAADLVPIGPPPTGDVRVGLLPGPRRDWFGDDAWAALASAPWMVTERTDRTGIRLDGPPLPRARSGELPSEGMVPGAIQVSPDGVPTILGVDGPVTGGYPVLGVVPSVFLDALAQVRPGQRLRLTPGHR
jgi:biotin-dependent carboxylase-like uncharacterized protein